MVCKTCKGVGKIRQTPWYADYICEAPVVDCPDCKENNLPSNRDKFNTLVECWKHERMSILPSSQIADYIACPSYLRIIGIGKPMLPFIIEKLDQPDHWMPALEAITGVNPVPKEDEGNLIRSAIHWKEWYKLFGGEIE